MRVSGTSSETRECIGFQEKLHSGLYNEMNNLDICVIRVTSTWLRH